MNPGKFQTCTVTISYRMLIIQKISCSNKEYTSTISQNLSGSLSKPRIFIGDGSICEDSTWQQSPNHFKISPLHCDVNSWHHANFQPFLTYFPFSLFSETKKSIFTGFQNNVFTYCGSKIVVKPRKYAPGSPSTLSSSSPSSPHRPQIPSSFPSQPWPLHQGRQVLRPHHQCYFNGQPPSCRRRRTPTRSWSSGPSRPYSRRWPRPRRISGLRPP